MIQFRVSICSACFLFNPPLFHILFLRLLQSHPFSSPSSTSSTTKTSTKKSLALFSLHQKSTQFSTQKNSCLAFFNLLFGACLALQQSPSSSRGCKAAFAPDALLGPGNRLLFDGHQRRISFFTKHVFLFHIKKDKSHSPSSPGVHWQCFFSIDDSRQRETFICATKSNEKQRPKKLIGGFLSLF